MQPVNVLPVFISQDTDLKSKESSGTSADSNKDANFSSLVEQHLPEESKLNSRKETVGLEQKTTAIDDKSIADDGKSQVDEIKSSQERDSKELVDTSNTSKDGSVDGVKRKYALPNNGALTESEQFIALLYNSDQTLAVNSGKSKAGQETSTTNSDQVNDVIINSKNSNAKAVVLSSLQDNFVLTSEHKLKVFSKDELLAGTQLKNNNTVAMQSSSQVLKDYQLSLQAQQSVIKSESITRQQLMDAQLANTQLSNNKITDVISGISVASKSQLTEQVDIGLYQLPVEEVDKEESITDEISIKESAVKRDINQSENKASLLIKSQAEIDAKLVSKVNEEMVVSSAKTFDSSTEIKDVNLSNRDSEISQLSTANVDKLIVEQNLPTSVENISKEQPMMKQSQLQVLQQVEVQQQLQSVISEQQAIEEVGEEFIDPILLGEDKPIEPSVKASSKVFDNIAMRSLSDIQNQTVQATQTRQSNAAYLEHQISEVLNHNIASDTVQIQKNNTLLQQETVSIFRKDFADAVKDKVMMTINQKLQRFDITLDPPEFGNMQVRVNLQGEQASVNFIVQNQQAKDVLEQNMHKLRDMLSEQGVDVGDANVEQQNQQQNNDKQKSPQNNDSNTALINGAQKDEHDVKHTLSAKLFDSSATSVDYYA